MGTPGSTNVSVSLHSQWSPLPDRPGDSRRYVLAGAGGSYHWTNPPVLPHSGDERLQHDAEAGKSADLVSTAGNGSAITL